MMKRKTQVALMLMASVSPVVAQSGYQVIQGTRVFTSVDQAKGVASFSNNCGTQVLTQRQLQDGAIPNEIIPCPRPPLSPSSRSNSNPTDDQTPSEESKLRMVYRKIGLKCPTTLGNGTLELIEKNELGMLKRSRFVFKDRLVMKVSVESASENRDYVFYKNLDLMALGSGEDREFARERVKEIDPIREHVCEGTAEMRKQYTKFLDSNVSVLENIKKMDEE